MDHRDALVSDVEIVVDRAHAEKRLPEVLEQLKAAGVEIDSVDESNGCIEGTVEAGKVRSIEKMEGISFVRTVFTYIADYAAGDPRDRDVP